MEKDNNSGTSLKEQEIRLKNGKKGQVVKIDDKYIFMTPHYTQRQMNLIVALLIFILGIVILYGIYQAEFIYNGFVQILMRLEQIQRQYCVGADYGISLINASQSG